MPPKKNNNARELNKNICEKIEVIGKDINICNSPEREVEHLSDQETLVKTKLGSIKKTLLQLILLICERQKLTDFIGWTMVFNQIVTVGKGLLNEIPSDASNNPARDLRRISHASQPINLQITLSHLSVWIKIVRDLLDMANQGKNTIDCSIYQLMMIHLFEFKGIKKGTLIFPDEASEIVDMAVFKPLVSFAEKYPHARSCIPERAFVHQSLVRKDKNIAIKIISYFHEQETISPEVAGEVVKLFLLGRDGQRLLMNPPNFSSIYSDEARQVEEAKKARQEDQAEQEVKYDGEYLEQSLWSDDGNRILAKLIQYGYDDVLLSLKNEYSFALRNEDLIFICESIGIKKFENIDDGQFDLLFKLKNKPEPQKTSEPQQTMEEFKEEFERIFNDHLNEQREIEQRKQTESMDSFSPVHTDNTGKSTGRKKNGSDQKNRRRKQKKKGVRETKTESPVQRESRPSPSTQELEDRLESLEVKSASHETQDKYIEDQFETEDLSETLEMFCSDDGYGRFNLANKLGEVLTSLDAFHSSPEKAPIAVKNISSVIKRTKEIEEKMAGLLKHNPYSGQSTNPGNKHEILGLNVPHDLLDSAKQCAEIIILCEVVKGWGEAVKKIFEDGKSDRLSTESWRQWKRYLFLQYFVANKIKAFIKENFPKFTYDDEKQCYQIIDSKMSDNVRDMFNELLERRGAFGLYLSDLRQKGNEVRVNTPRFKHDKKPPSFSLTQNFGALCSQICINNKDEEIESNHRIRKLINKSCGSDDAPDSKFSDMEKMSKLDFSSQLITSFILLSPGQVSLPRALRDLREEQIWLDPKAIKIDRLPSMPSPKRSKTTPMLPLPSSPIPTHRKLKDLGDWSYHPILAKLPQNWFKPGRIFCLGGGFAGLLGLGESLDTINDYLAANGDIDVLCIGDVRDISSFLTSKIFRSYKGQYTSHLWEHRGILHNERFVPIDLVQITANSEEDVTPLELVRQYKENSSITLLGGMVYELSADGYYRLVYGDERALKRQVLEKSIELINHEQLQQVIDEVKQEQGNRQSRENKRKNKQAEGTVLDRDDVGLSVFKSFKTVIKLSSLSKWKKRFSIGPYSQKLIGENHEQIVSILRNISKERKQKFLQSMFDMPKNFLYRYLQLLLEQRLFYAFFYMNPANMGREEGNKISKYNKMAGDIEQWFGLHTDKTSERLHNQATVFLAMENYFKSQSRKRASSSEFLASMAQRCSSHTYLRSYQKTYQKKLSKGTLLECNPFRSKLNEFNQEFNREKQQALQVLLHPKDSTSSSQGVSSSPRGVFLLQKGNLIPSARKYYKPPEIEIKDVEAVPSLAEQLCEEIQHELYAQVRDKLRGYSSIEEMSASKFVMKISDETFSVNLDKEQADRSHKSAASDDRCMFVVFFVHKNEGWHTFLSVFEEETNEGDMVVKAPKDAVSLLENLDSGTELYYCQVAPYLGTLYEWSACHRVGNSTVKIPLLENLLAKRNHQLSSPGQEDYKLDETILPIVPSLTQEQNAFSQQVVQRILDKETLQSILMGPPGTGKTRTIRDLILAIAKRPDISAHFIILTHSKSVVKQTGCGFASSGEQITVTYRTDKTELDEKDSNQHPSLDALLGQSNGSGKSRGWVSWQLTAIKERQNPDIGEDVQQIHELQERIRQLMPVFAHQINAVLNILIEQLVSNADDRRNRRKKIFKENDEEIQSLIWNNSSYKAAILATSQVVVVTLHGAYNRALWLALQLRQEILNERRLIVVEEASRAPLSSIFPALVRCMNGDRDLGNDHMLIGGDLMQLGSVTHGQVERFSVLRWFSEQVGSWFQLHYCFRTGPKGVRGFSELGYQGSVRSGHQEGFFEQRSRALIATRRVPYLKAPLMFVDVKGREEQRGHSHFNEEEIKISLKLILETVQAIMQSGDETLKKVAFIAMYKAQVDYMKQEMRKLGLPDEMMKYIKCGTVDEFQGDEASVVFVSLVRTTDCGHILHIERLIVALSRAILATVVIGNKKLLERNAQMIMGVVTHNPLNSAVLQRQEGVFIKQCEPNDDTVLCLVKGHEGQLFWCRLSQNNQQQDHTIQVDVLLKEQRKGMEPSESPGFFAALKQQKDVMYRFELPSFSLEQIKQKRPDVLKNLKLLLLNRMASRMPTPFVMTRANLALIHQRIQQHPGTMISAESLDSTPTNSR